jgi:hypothetical protein
VSSEFFVAIAIQRFVGSRTNEPILGRISKRLSRPSKTTDVKFNRKLSP